MSHAAHARTALLVVVAWSVGACAKDPDRQSQSHRLEGRFDLGDPGDGWAIQRPGGADRAWYHQGYSAAIYADSNCGSRYEDGPLGDMLTHLSFGIAVGEPVSEATMRIDDRDALMRTWNGALDGVAVRLGAVATKKHHCMYDLLYIAPPDHFDQGWSDFVQVVDGFRARSR